MKPIGLIAAMGLEAGSLLRITDNARRISIGKYPGNYFSVEGYECVLVTSGMGMRRARDAAQTLVERHSPSVLISFGIAGAVEPELQIGDVVLAENFCTLVDGCPGEPIRLGTWSEAAREAVKCALSPAGIQLFTGTAVTTSGTQVTQEQLGELIHPILEMETAGIAPVAMQAGIPLLSLRSISDGPSAPIPFDLGKVMDNNANLKIGRLVGEVLRHPGILFQTRRLMENNKLASENAALALLAALRTVQLIAVGG